MIGVMPCSKALSIFLFTSSFVSPKVISSPECSVNNYVFHPCICKHSRRDFSCVSAFFFKVHVLSANLDICILVCFTTGMISIAGTQTLRQLPHFLPVVSEFLINLPASLWSHVHFPVSSDNFLSCHDDNLLILFNNRLTKEVRFTKFGLNLRLALLRKFDSLNSACTFGLSSLSSFELNSH